MFIPISSILIGLMIILIPFMLLFVLMKKFLSKEKDNLLLRVEILEQEIKDIKEHIKYIDEL